MNDPTPTLPAALLEDAPPVQEAYERMTAELPADTDAYLAGKPLEADMPGTVVSGPPAPLERGNRHKAETARVQAACKARKAALRLRVSRARRKAADRTRRAQRGR